MTAYFDGGTPETPATIDRIVTSDDQAIERSDSSALAARPKSIYDNDYRYNQFCPRLFGISAKMVPDPQYRCLRSVEASLSATFNTR